MGYTTDFGGSLTLSRPLTKKQRDYINLLSETRRMKRDVNKLMEIYNGKHGYPFTKSKNPKKIYGNDGEYFARNDGNAGQIADDSIIDYNTPPGQMEHNSISDFDSTWNENEKRISEGTCQPGLWCQWVISEDGTELMWDGMEKFYNYIEWLAYYINHFFEPWGIKLNGEISWVGEDPSDIGKIVVKDNQITILEGVITFKKVK